MEAGKTADGEKEETSEKKEKNKRAKRIKKEREGEGRETARSRKRRRITWIIRTLQVFARHRMERKKKRTRKRE